MAFVIQPLADTEFYTIGFSALGLREQRIPAKVRKIPWQCAVDNQEDGPSTLATQLVSSSLEMREGLYFYILLIERDPVFLALSFPDAYLLDRGSIEKFPLDYIRETFNAAAEVVTVDNKPFRFPDPELLHSGLSLSL